MPSRLPDSSSSSGPGAGPLLMSSTGEDDGDGGGEKSSEEQKGSDDGNGEAAPVDAELAEPPSGGGGGGGGVGDLLPEMGDPATRAALKQKLLRKGMFYIRCRRARTWVAKQRPRRHGEKSRLCLCVFLLLQLFTYSSSILFFPP